MLITVRTNKGEKFARVAAMARTKARAVYISVISFVRNPRFTPYEDSPLDEFTDERDYVYTTSAGGVWS